MSRHAKDHGKLRHATSIGAQTTDAGKTWSVGTVPGAEKLDFRDVEAFADATAYLLSAGQGDASRIYKNHRWRQVLDAAMQKRRPGGLS